MIASSRLLVLQSKRLLLSGLQRQFRNWGFQADDKTLEHLRAEVETAEDAYREARLACGGSVRSERLREAFGHMVDVGNNAVSRLRRAASGVAPAQRFEIATDVQTFEELIGHWRDLSGDSDPLIKG